MILGLDCARPCAWNSINESLFQVCDEYAEQKMMLHSFFLQTMFIQKTKGNAKCIYWPISAKSTSFSTEIIRFIYFFYSFFLFLAVRKKAQNGTNGKKDTFFGLIFCFQKTEPLKNYFFACSKLGAFGVILTMQREPPRHLVSVFSWEKRKLAVTLRV